MGAVWSEQRKLDNWLEVELAVVDALAEAGAVPADRRAPAIRERAAFTVEAVKEREKVTDHDVAAFVDVVAASVGDGRPLGPLRAHLVRRPRHRARAAAQAGRRDPRGGRAGLPRRARARARASTSDTICVGRTHGIQAEPTTFGVKLAGLRVRGRAQPAPARGRGQAGVGRRAVRRGRHLRGERAGARGGRARAGSGSAREDVSTQVVARDRHAQYLNAIALAGAGLERFATEIRHLQRTEVREVEEPFRAGQKGSSAMPHKRNPIVSERIMRHRAAAARLRAGRARERRALARARHLALVGGAGRAARRLRSCSTTRSTWRSGWSRA